MALNGVRKGIPFCFHSDHGDPLTLGDCMHIFKLFLKTLGFLSVILHSESCCLQSQIAFLKLVSWIYLEHWDQYGIKRCVQCQQVWQWLHTCFFFQMLGSFLKCIRNPLVNFVVLWDLYPFGQDRERICPFSALSQPCFGVCFFTSQNWSTDVPLFCHRSLLGRHSFKHYLIMCMMCKYICGHVVRYLPEKTTWPWVQAMKVFIS